jgi:hemolysin activation/secretion protein
MLDATLSGNAGPFASAITMAGGMSAGDVPLQREFFVGGLQTVRGERALPVGAGRTGNSFWLGRAEVGPRWLAMRPTLFYDVGWAGSRADFMRSGRPLSGAGIGLSFLGGVLRFDAARGIWPERRWRFDLSLGPRL